MSVAGRYQLLNDNLLDLTHLAYLHRTSIGVEANASTPEQREETDRVIRSRRFMTDVPQAEVLRSRIDYDGPVDRTTGMDFYLPGFHAGVDETSIPRDHPTRGGELLRVARVFHAVTPAQTRSANYFFSMGGPMTEAELDFMQEYLRSVVAEDVFATVEIETLLSSLDHAPNELMLKSDTTAVQARRALQAMMEKERSNQ